MTFEDYIARLRALDEWLRERRLYVVPDRGSDHLFTRNPAA